MAAALNIAPSLSDDLHGARTSRYDDNALMGKHHREHNEPCRLSTRERDELANGARRDSDRSATADREDDNATSRPSHRENKDASTHLSHRDGPRTVRVHRDRSEPAHRKIGSGAVPNRPSDVQVEAAVPRGAKRAAPQLDLG